MENPDQDGTNTKEGDSKKNLPLKMVLSITVFSQGAYRYIPGATIIDLGARIHESILNMPLIYSARSVGYVIGIVFGTLVMQRVLYSKQKKCLIFFLMTFLICVSIFSISMLQTFAGVLISFFCSGIWMAIVDCGLKAICLHSDIQRNQFYLTLYLFYGLGAFFAPLIARSYVRRRVNISWLAERPDIQNSTDTNPWHLNYITSISYAYIFISLLFLISSLLWLVLYSFVSSDPPQKPLEEDFTESVGRKMKFACIINAAVMAFFSESVAFSYVQVLPVVYVIGTKTAVVRGVDLILLFLGFFTLVQLISIFVSTKMEVNSMLILGVSMAFTGSIIDYCYVKIDVTYFWVATAFLGFGVGPLFPCNYSWLCLKLKINHFNIVPIFLTSSLSELTIPWILSRVVWLETPNAFHFVLTVTLAYFALTLIQFFLLHGVKSRQQEPEPAPVSVVEVMPPSILKRFRAPETDAQTRKQKQLEKIPSVASMHAVDPSKIFERLSELRERVEKSNRDALMTLKELNDV